MKLGFRIFLFYLAIFAACLYFTTDWIWTTLRTRFLEIADERIEKDDRKDDRGIDPLAEHCRDDAGEEQDVK